MADLTKGTVVRGISNAGAFTKEDLDQHGRLMDASVNAKEGVYDIQTVAEGMVQANFKRGYAACKVEDIIKKGGRVMEVPVRGNDNHCQSFGLQLSDANNLFSNVKPW